MPLDPHAEKSPELSITSRRFWIIVPSVNFIALRPVESSICSTGKAEFGKLKNFKIPQNEEGKEYYEISSIKQRRSKY